VLAILNPRFDQDMSNDGNNITILIVEDDNAVRDLAVEMFTSEGFAVLEALDAKSALELFEQHPEIDLVFSDLILPGGVTGIELTKKILEEKPGTPVILATGYQDKGAAIAANTGSMDNISYVPKPYDIEAIPEMVRAMLANRANSVNV
jgi:DNA-binding NtrC family response regulator